MLARGDRQHDIASYFGVNGGRIGEIATGDKSTIPRYGVTLLQWGTGFASEHGLVEKGISRGEAHNYSMEVRSDPFESAKSHFFDTSSWGEFCDVTLTLKQALQPDRGSWVKIDDNRCRQAFRHFMNLLNRAVYGSAFRRHGKRLRVLPVLEKARSVPARYVNGSAAL